MACFSHLLLICYILIHFCSLFVLNAIYASCDATQIETGLDSADQWKHFPGQYARFTPVRFICCEEADEKQEQQRQQKQAQQIDQVDSSIAAFGQKEAVCQLARRVREALKVAEKSSKERYGRKLIRRGPVHESQLQPHLRQERVEHCPIKCRSIVSQS